MELKQHYMEILASLKLKGLTPSKFILERSTSDDKHPFDELFNHKTPWYLKFYYAIYRKVDFLFYSSTYKRLWQRMTRGWDDSDTWSLDYTIAKFIAPRLKRLKELKHGIPGQVMGDCLEEEGLKWHEHSETAEKKAITLWDSYMDEMIWAFEFYQYEYNEYADEWAWIRYHNAMQLFIKYYQGLWD